MPVNWLVAWTIYNLREPMKEGVMGSNTRQLAERLRAFKDRSGHSFEALGPRLNTSASSLHRYCSGAAVPPTFHVVEKLALESGADADEVAGLRELWEAALGEASARSRPAVPGPAKLGLEPGSPEEPPSAEEGTETAGPTSSVPVATARRRRPWLVGGVAAVGLVPVAVFAVPWSQGRQQPDAVGYLDASARSHPSAATECVSRRGVSHTDPFHDDRVYTVDFLCPNTAKAAMVSMADFRTKIADMETTSSWFLCWERRPTAENNRNEIWYYSQGDNMVPGFEKWVAWGFMSAKDVPVPAHPVPGMPHC